MNSGSNLPSESKSQPLNVPRVRIPLTPHVTARGILAVGQQFLLFGQIKTGTMAAPQGYLETRDAKHIQSVTGRATTNSQCVVHVEKVPVTNNDHTVATTEAMSSDAKSCQLRDPYRTISPDGSIARTNANAAAKETAGDDHRDSELETEMDEQKEETRLLGDAKEFLPFVPWSHSRLRMQPVYQFDLTTQLARVRQHPTDHDDRFIFPITASSKFFAVSPDQKHAITMQLPPSIHVHHRTSGNGVNWTIPNASLQCVAWFADSENFLLCLNGSIALGNVHYPQRLVYLLLNDMDNGAISVDSIAVFSEGYAFAASRSDGRVCLYDDISNEIPTFATLTPSAREPIATSLVELDAAATVIDPMETAQYVYRDLAAITHDSSMQLLSLRRDTQELDLTLLCTPQQFRFDQIRIYLPVTPVARMALEYVSLFSLPRLQPVNTVNPSQTPSTKPARK